MRRFLPFLTVLALLAIVVACSGGDDGGGEDADQGASNSSDEDDDSGESSSVDIDFGGDDDRVEEVTTEDVIEVIQEFWEDRASDIGVDYEPLPDDRVGAIPGDQPVICDGFELTPDFVAGNAYAQVCSEGISVIWDPAFVDETLGGMFGAAAPPVVFAHEWGHIMQFQSGIIDITGQNQSPPSVLTETQADCFAGAWVSEQVEDGYGPFADPASLDNALGTMIAIRDAPGSDPDNPVAHGSGFDRVRSFQDGFEGGVEYCFGYIEDPPFIAQLPFGEQDVANQGNLPFDEVTELVVQDLDGYYSENVDDFDGPSDPFDVVPEDELEDLHAEVGDGAVATVFGMLWAERAQDSVGADLDGQGPLLQRACLLGSWLGDIVQDQRDGEVDRESGVSLSPGDLDETIITFLELTSDAMTGPGVAFEAVADMRLGVFGGLERCRLGN